MKNWSSANSYLRLLSTQPQELNQDTTFCTQSVSELQLVLATIQMYVKHMSSTEDVTIQITISGNVGTIRFFRKGSKEMF